MGFLQVITFATDNIDEFVRREHQWVVDSTGQRTSVGGQLWADRDRPGHYVALDWFDSYESAMVNSHLPVTDEFAHDAMALATGEVVFHNLEPHQPEWNSCEAALRVSLESSTAAEQTFTDDVDLDILVPHGRTRSSGVVALEESLRAEAPGRDIELWEAHATFDGFVVEYAYRTHGTPSLAAGIMLVTMRDGRIARLAITCAGNWSAETEARVLAETGALGRRVAEAVR
jgi:hypothetical protein